MFLRRLLFPFAAGVSFRIASFPMSSIASPPLSDCEKLKVLEKQLIDIYNDQTVASTVEEAQSRAEKRNALQREISRLEKSCKEAEQKKREELIRQRQEKEKQDRIAQTELATKNAPVFFNKLVDAVENDKDMHAALMVYVSRGDGSIPQEIVLYSSSEWRRHVYESFSYEKKFFSYSELQMMSFNDCVPRTIQNGQFKGYYVRGTWRFVMSIFVIPTLEHEIVMYRKKPWSIFY